MKKVIFISALAIAAAVSCTKSDIVDTKFNEQISFQTYVGRDAQTKATVNDLDAIQAADKGFGVYGFYTAKAEYEPETGTKYNFNANLLTQEHVTYNGTAWTYQNTKYWTNAEDFYTFLAYAPYTLTTSESKSGETFTGPVINYTLAQNVDVLYSKNNIDIHKQSPVAFTFQHALARVTVTASATVYGDGDNTFRVKSITLSDAAFKTAANFNLATGAWEDGATTGEASFDFTVSETQKAAALTATPVDFGASNGNYFMMIPTTFANGSEAELTVVYTVTSAGVESSPIEKTVKVAQNFAQGTAYAINLAFALNPENQITFDVTSVAGWGENVPVTPTPANPETAK